MPYRVSGIRLKANSAGAYGHDTYINGSTLVPNSINRMSGLLLHKVTPIRIVAMRKTTVNFVNASKLSVLYNMDIQ